jgi:hypothetical protein
MKRLINLRKKLNIFFVLFGVLLFCISCEDDFTTLGGNFVNSINFPEPYVVEHLAAYSDNISSVQSNNLSTYLLGQFNDPVYGNSDVSILSQLRLQSTNPDFGENPVLDSVVLSLPLFISQITGTDEDSGKDNYILDSIFGEGTFKLGVYESNQFLADIDPGDDGDFESPKSYYSNQFAEFESNILTSNPLTTITEGGVTLSSEFSKDITPSDSTRTQIYFDKLDEINVDTLRLSPRITIKLDTEFFQQKILDQQNSINLLSQNSFENFFRGLYIKAVSTNDQSVMVNLSIINQESNITLYYRSDRLTTVVEEGEEGEEPVVVEELVETFNKFRLSFGDNIVNFYDNTNSLDLNNQNTNIGEEYMFIKGGQGVVGIINPFNGPDLDGNGVADEIDELRSNNWLVNEANLILYVDESVVGDNYNNPFRIFAYDLDRERVLIDYNIDPTASQNPFTSRIVHLQPLQEDDDGNPFYKIRITSHINNIINNDSTNSRIGVIVTQNVNQSGVLEVRESVLNEVESFLQSAMSTPRGTVFYGNLPEDEEKRLKLQIYYTESN